MRRYRSRSAVAAARALVATGLVTLAARAAGAQGAHAPPLANGTRVRVTADVLGSGPRVASVLGVRGDTLMVRPTGTRDSVALPMHAIAQLEISGGQHPRALKGIGVGFLVGAAGGAISGVATYKDCNGAGECWFDVGRGGAAVAGGIGGGLLGAVVGGVTGAIWTAERWDRVPFVGRSAQLRIGPGGRAGVALALTF